MSDYLHDYRCLLEGKITLDRTAPHNTSGGFCDLFTANHPTAAKLALKRPRGNHPERLVAHVEIEARVWASLKHPRILQFLGIHKIGDDVYLVSAFAENGSLPGFLERRPNVDRRQLVIEVAEGLAYLHQRGIIHGDLKGNNVLVSREEHVLLCDFGLAKHVTTRTLTSLKGVGSIPWQSPELLQDASRRTYQSDVYAFGITVYEVLSGNEPYAHHAGIVSIITGALFNGERPPKEPELALDGSSYLQFWDEASQCWAEDSSLRPRITDVLGRLDRRRAETLITSQQRVLEESLFPLEGTPTSQLPEAPELLPLRSDGANKQDTLDWAHRIRIRMSLLVNAQKPVCRIPPEVIIKIIENDLGTTIEKSSPNWGSDFKSCTDSYVRRILRCADLATVCKSWLDAIEKTGELTGCILVDARKKKIIYVGRSNCDSPLEFFLEDGDCPTWSELSSLLGSLARRVRSLNTWSTDISFGSPSPFPMLRAVRIHGSHVPDTFAADLLGMLHANQDLVELSLNKIHGGDSGGEDWPRLRIDHSGLQRVQLMQVWPPLQSHILHCLGLNSSVILKINQIRPEDLRSPDSAFGNLIRSLGWTRRLAHGVEVFSKYSNKITNNCASIVMFRCAVHCHALIPGGQSSRSTATSEWSQLWSKQLTTPHTVDMIRMLQDWGLELKYAELSFIAAEVPTNLFRCLSPTTRLKLPKNRSALQKVLYILGQPLQPDPESADERLQYLCPNLTIIDLVKLGGADSYSPAVYDDLYRMVQNRQTETRPTNGLVKLQKIILPKGFYMEHDFRGPVFRGIEINPNVY